MLKNGVFFTLRFGIYTLSGLLFIPFLVRQYGSGTYGLIALAGFLTQYIGMVSSCVGVSIARFLNIALNRNDWTQANEIYSTALVANFGFILLQLPVFALGIWKLDWLISFPPEIGFDFRVLVACNVAVFFISQITGVLSTPILASNKLYLITTADAIRIALRLILLVALIKLVGAKLWFIGIVDLCLSIGNIAVVYLISRGLATDLVFRLKHVTKAWIRPVLNMAGWTLVTALGGALFVKTDVWMINRFVSKEMAGVYAALLIWPNFLKQISKQFAGILAPVYMIDYARGDIQRVANLSFSSAKMLGCFVALAVGVLYVVAEPLLVFWLGAGFGQHVALFRLMIIYLVFTIGESVIWQIYTTLNRVHITGVISIAAGVLNIGISMLLIYQGFGAVGVALGTVIGQLVACALAVPMGVCHELKIPYRRLGNNQAAAGLLLLISFLSAWVGFRISTFSIIGGLLAYIMLLIGGCFIFTKVALSSEERGIMWRLVMKIATKLGIPDTTA